MDTRNKSLVYIHIAVILFGFSALFAKWINQPSVIITFGRVFFSSLFLFLLTRFRKNNLSRCAGKDYFFISAAGIILAIHWYCFIQSIRLSSVAIGTITFSSFPVFTAFLEPIFFKEKIKIRTVICSVVMLAGVLIITPVFGESGTAEKTAGIAVGLVSSLTYAALSLLNRNFSMKYSSGTIVFYEQAIAALILFPFIFTVGTVPSLKDLVLLAVLGIVFTAFAHGLFVKGLRHVKAGTAGIISGLEAVYSIVLASALMREIPAVNEIAGGGIVILAAVCMTLVKKD